MAELAALVVGVSVAIERLRAQQARAVGLFDRRGLARVDGVWSTKTWLIQRVGALAPAQAGLVLRLARRLTDMPASATAWSRGRIGAAHVDVLVRACTYAPGPFADVEAQLVGWATDHEFTRFEMLVGEWIRHAAPDAGRDPFEHRALRLRDVGSQTDVRGVLPHDDGAALRAAVEHYAERLWRHDRDLPVEQRRTRAQRNADAIVEMARVAMAGSLSDAERARPQLCLTVARSELAADPAEIGGGGRCDHGGWIDRASLRRLACDAEITPIIVDGDGHALHVGRTARTATPAQRRALIARYGGCAAPACAAPPAWCDAHHIIWWELGGPTDLDNLTLLCRHHHRLIHNQRWQLTRAPNGDITLTPPAHAPPRAA